MTPTSMTASELAAARSRLGLTANQFATELELPLHLYEACESGELKLPKHQAELVAFRLAGAERDEALTQSGLPTCAWFERWERDAPPDHAALKKHVAHMERVAAHLETCTVCQAREQFVKDRFPNMPKLPMATWMRVLGAVTRWVDARPEWIRPAFYGAAILAVMTSMRAAIMLLVAARDPRVLVTALGAIVLASAAGAGGGLVYSFLGKPARRVPVVGPYLAGIIAVAGYVACGVALLALSGEWDGRGGWTGALAAFGFVSTLFGVIVGHAWFRPATLTS
jgi:hypothetical protein